MVIDCADAEIPAKTSRDTLTKTSSDASLYFAAHERMFIFFGDAIVDRYAEKDDTETWPGEFWNVDKKQDTDGACQQDIEYRQHGIADGFIGSG